MCIILLTSSSLSVARVTGGSRGLGAIGTLELRESGEGLRSLAWAVKYSLVLCLLELVDEFLDSLGANSVAGVEAVLSPPSVANSLDTLENSCMIVSSCSDCCAGLRVSGTVSVGRGSSAVESCRL